MVNPGRWLRIAEIMTEHNRIIDDKILDSFIYTPDNYQQNLLRLQIATITSVIALLLVWHRQLDISHEPAD